MGFTQQKVPKLTETKTYLIQTDPESLQIHSQS